jgi:hypothetical protein
MGASRMITPTWLMDFESSMRVEMESEFSRLASNVWWPKVAKVRPSSGRRELVAWLLSTAQIYDQGDGGNMRFDDLVSVTTEYENKFSGAGLKLQRAQLEDSDGNGLDLASQWSTDMGFQMSYWPQAQTTDLLKNGHTLARYPAYTTKAFFATDHPNNPHKSSAGTYSNLHTGGTYRIDDGVTADVALQNMGKLFSKIAEMKMPNGVQPRFLRPKTILCGPRMFPRVVQLTGAKVIAQAAATGGGGADVEALINALGYSQPVMADELAGFETDTTYFVVCEQAATSKLGPVIYSEREPYSVRYYGLQDDAELSKIDNFEWHLRGRNVIAPGHPYLLHKVTL